MSIAHVQWSCSTCGSSFSREQLRPRVKQQPKAEVLRAEIL
jgi:hypothetical protein